MNTNEMNREAATICGYSVIPSPSFEPAVLMCKDGIPIKGQSLVLREDIVWAIMAPKFCQDRNAIPELWKALCASGDFIKFIRILFPNGSDWDWFRAVKMTFDVTPIRFVECALRATGRWKEE